MWLRRGRERDGFKRALEWIFGISRDDFDLESFYAYCQIHFDRSWGCTAMKNDVVPIQWKDEFRQPQCRYCISYIQQGEWHTVRRRKNSTSNNWDHTWHYHLQCFHHLSPAERRQLLAIATQCEHISEVATAQLENTIEDVPRRQAPDEMQTKGLWGGEEFDWICRFDNSQCFHYLYCWYGMCMLICNGGRYSSILNFIEWISIAPID